MDMSNRSTFKSVSEYCETMRTNFEEDNRISSKNILYLKSSFKVLEDNFREDLSAITKEMGNKIISDYDNYASSINEQKCENLRLQEEIYTLTSEKNSLKHDIKLLINSVKRLENLLGVNPDPKYNSIVNQVK